MIKLSFKELHDNEAEIYYKITALFKTYDLKLPSNKQLNLFKKIHAWHKNLSKLQRQRIELVREIITVEKEKPIYVKTSINNVMIQQYQEEVELIKNQKNWQNYGGKLYNIFCNFFSKSILKPKKNQLDYLSEQYHFFINKVIDFTKINDFDKLHLCALILRIMATPIGQRLILKLNLVKYKRGNIKIAVKYGKGFTLQASLKRKDRAKCQCKDSDLMPEGDSRQAYKNYGKKGQPIDQVFVIIPENYLSKPADIVAGKTKIGLVYQPQFISLLHEFIHCLHKLRGRDRNILTFRHSMRSPMYYLYYNGLFASIEEKWTIAHANISENTAREQNGLPLRLGLLGKTLCNDSKPPDFSGIIFFTRYVMGHTDFKELYISPDFKIPRCLDTGNLKGITGISFRKHF